MGIRPEPTDELVVRKPKAPGRSSVKTTLYRAYAEPIPDPTVLSVGAKLCNLQPQPGICKILCGLSYLTLVDSKFGLVPRGFLVGNVLGFSVSSLLNLVPLLKGGIMRVAPTSDSIWSMTKPFSHACISRLKQAEDP
ncbi:hypothetical protein UPYG_G00243470 [Umbra pygmaea]|uniref:Uncharacterized protein n=1 Tax=Umbra pygmaea TaxID=75934 RepID=A0ABD0WFT5_UMBPY